MRIASLGLIAALVAISNAATFAQPTHTYCAAQHHDCGRSAKVAKCCCGDEQRDTSTAAGPIQSRVEVSADTTAIPVAMTVSARVASALTAAIAIKTSPPRYANLDVSILFSTFLI